MGSGDTVTLLPADRSANLVIWAVVWAAVLVWAVVTIRSPLLPTFVDLVRFVCRFWLLRWALLAFWIWLGWHLLVRTTA